jgi:undecaprenyl-diphosphatase
MKSVKKSEKTKRIAYRNPIYVVYIVFGIALFVLGALVANGGSGPFETALFNTLNHLPDFLLPLFLLLSLFGTIGFALLLAVYGLFKKRYIFALKVFLAGVGAYALAYGLKLLDIRARPQALFDVANIRESAIATNGYPSGHVAVATALAIILYQYIPSRFHKYITFTVLGVALSRLYLGVHLPADLLGGFALGLVVGSVVCLALGRSVVPKVSVKDVKDALATYGFKAKTVKVLSVDARGSSPFIVTDEENKNHFLKVVSKENFVADWLFKSWRKIVYRRLEDEAPYFSPKRQIEHESYVANLALANGINTPKIVGVYEIGMNNWAQMQEMIDGKSLDRVDVKSVSDTVLNKIFKLVSQLHDAQIIHRDLRTANIFLDNKNEPWLIDFGFGEASVKRTKSYRDIVELMASLSVLVGSDRTVKAAVKNLPKNDLVLALGYLNYPSLSSETTRLLKERKKLLPEIREKLTTALGIKEVKLVKLQRISLKNLIIILILGLAIYFVSTQFEDFQNSIAAIKDADLNLILVSALFSVLTYFTASMVYKLIAIKPIPYFRTLLVQITSSFTNRLLPAGTGGLATFGRYLVKEGHTQPQAIALASINNLLGFIGMLILTVSVAIISKTPIKDAIAFSIPGWVPWLVGMLLLTIVVLTFIVPNLKSLVIKTAKSIKKDLRLIAAEPWRLVLALIFSMAITACYAAVLYFAIHALGAEATVLQTFIVLTAGVAAASVTPTPGGIGGAEAGLVAGLTSIGIPADLGLSIALVYRFVTFWLPILPGFIAFQIALKRNVL